MACAGYVLRKLSQYMRNIAQLYALRLPALFGFIIFIVNNNKNCSSHNTSKRLGIFSKCFILSLPCQMLGTDKLPLIGAGEKSEPEKITSLDSLQYSRKKSMPLNYRQIKIEKSTFCQIVSLEYYMASKLYKIKSKLVYGMPYYS